MSIGTFTDGGAQAPSADLIRHPFVDIANAPTDEESDHMYELARWSRAFDRSMEWRAILNGRKRHIEPQE